MPKKYKAESAGEKSRKRQVHVVSIAFQVVRDLERGEEKVQNPLGWSLLFYSLTKALCRSLEGVGDNDSNSEESSPFTAEFLAKGAIEIVHALAAHGMAKPEKISEIVSRAIEWPVVAAIDSSVDIRRINKNTEGNAAKYYRLLLKDLGKGILFPAPSVRKRGVFQTLAWEAAEIIYQIQQQYKSLSGLGLPGPLDFTSGTKAYFPPEEKPDASRIENIREWVISVKYYLYLSLAPLPLRRSLQREWRKARLEAFKNLPLQGREAKVRNNRSEVPAIPAPTYPSTGPERITLPWILELELAPAFPEPPWRDWWNWNLQYAATAFFGNYPPLDEWSDPEIQKLRMRKAVLKRPDLAFGQCVSGVLNAFCRLCGVPGLETVENLKDPLPVLNSENGRALKRTVHGSL